MGTNSISVFHTASHKFDSCHLSLSKRLTLVTKSPASPLKNIYNKEFKNLRKQLIGGFSRFCKKIWWKIKYSTNTIERFAMDQVVLNFQLQNKYHKFIVHMSPGVDWSMGLNPVGPILAKVLTVGFSTLYCNRNIYIWNWETSTKSKDYTFPLQPHKSKYRSSKSKLTLYIFFDGGHFHK